MGTFHHGGSTQRVPDRDLALLQAVVEVQRWLGEPFLASFVDRDADRVDAYWLSAESDVDFAFDDDGEHPVDDWHLDLQLAEAASDAGVVVRAA